MDQAAGSAAWCSPHGCWPRLTKIVVRRARRRAGECPDAGARPAAARPPRPRKPCSAAGTRRPKKDQETFGSGTVPIRALGHRHHSPGTHATRCPQAATRSARTARRRPCPGPSRWDIPRGWRRPRGIPGPRAVPPPCAAAPLAASIDPATSMAPANRLKLRRCLTAPPAISLLGRHRSGNRLPLTLVQVWRAGKGEFRLLRPSH